MLVAFDTYIAPIDGARHPRNRGARSADSVHCTRNSSKFVKVHSFPVCIRAHVNEVRTCARFFLNMYTCLKLHLWFNIGLFALHLILTFRRNTSSLPVLPRLSTSCFSRPGCAAAAPSRSSGRRRRRKPATSTSSRPWCNSPRFCAISGRLKLKYIGFNIFELRFPLNLESCEQSGNGNLKQLKVSLKEACRSFRKYAR